MRWHPKYPFQYEAPLSLKDYTERGTELGAHLGGGQVGEPTFDRFLHDISEADLGDTLKWLEESGGTLSDKVVVTDTKDGRSLQGFKGAEVFIITRSLNEVRHLNTLLNCAGEVLPEGGYIWCHCKTSGLVQAEIHARYPRVISDVIYGVRYLWHRIMPKLHLTRWFYFWVTKGDHREFHRVEVLGRMYRAGFEVIDESFHYGEFFVTARKIKEPIWDVEPSGSPLIKLRRVGREGKLFGVFKLRTMHSYSEYLQPYIYEHNSLDEGGKFANDYRVSAWGRFLRKTWLDELPMAINLLKGQMKLVGVRPLSRQYFSLYTPEMQQLRTRVKPGLLPPFYYGAARPKTIEDVQASEKEYIESWLASPFKTDWRYFWGTVKNIVFKGARSR